MKFLRNLNPFALRRDNEQLNAVVAGLIVTNSALASMFGTLASDNIELIDERDMNDELLQDATKMSDRFQAALAEIASTVAGVKVPNGTTRKIDRIVTAALAPMEAAPVTELVDA
jgi:hypothetical protein